MTAKDFVRQWLNQHRGFTFEEVTPEEQAHFEQILTDVCEAYLENERKVIINQQIEKDIEIMYDSFQHIHETSMRIASNMIKNKIN